MRKYYCYALEKRRKIELEKYFKASCRFSIKIKQNYDKNIS